MWSRIPRRVGRRSLFHTCAAIAGLSLAHMETAFTAPLPEDRPERTSLQKTGLALYLSLPTDSL